MPTEIAGISILTLLIVFPLVVAALIWLVPPLRQFARQIALVASIVELAGVIGVFTAFDTANAAQYQFTQVNSWIPSFGASYAVGVNGLGLVLIAMAALLVPLVILAAWKEVTLPAGVGGDDPAAQAKALNYRIAGYMALILALEALIVAIFVARDVFFFYVVFEAMLIPVYFMIGVYGGPGRRSAAIKFLLYSLAGGLIMLAGVVGLYFAAGGGEQAFLMDNLQGVASDNLTVQMLLFLAFFFAFAVKAPMVPVHTWLPDAAAQGPAGTSTLLVGVLDKVGTFGMIVLCLPLFPEAVKTAAPYIIVLALISIIYGGIVAIGQKDLMRLIAFTSVSHFGFIVLGIHVGTETAMTGAMLYMVAHGLSTAGMFLAAGFLTQRGGTQEIAAYGGIQKVAPVLAGTFLISGLATLSLPGLSGFVPEFMVLLGAFQAAPWIGLVAVLGVVLAALYILLAYQKIFTGAPNPERAGFTDLVTREKVVMGVLVVGMLYLGFMPSGALETLTPFADSVAQIIGSAS